jgi:hypothetical protein
MCPQAAAPPAVAREFANGQNFREVGLHQCPSERKGEGVPVRSLRVPSHVPSHPQTAAKVRGFSGSVWEVLQKPLRWSWYAGDVAITGSFSEDAHHDQEAG